MIAHFPLRTYDVNKVFFRKKIGFDASFDVTMVPILDVNSEHVAHA